MSDLICISVLDYGIGNPRSVINMLQKLSIPCRMINSKSEIDNSEAIIIPGVGHFGKAVDVLKKLDYFQLLREFSDKERPLIGICLGMQLLCNGSEEGDSEGLSLVNAEVKKFQFEQGTLKVPNMGWREVDILEENLAINYPDDPRFYFTHSYYVDCMDKKNETILTEYGVPYSAGIRNGNVYGFQFHPEKSHQFGMQLFNNLYRTINAS